MQVSQVCVPVARPAMVATVAQTRGRIVENLIIPATEAMEIQTIPVMIWKIPKVTTLRRSRS